MNYIELTVEFDSNKFSSDIIIAELSDLPFDSFTEEDNMVKAYIIESDFNEQEFKNLEWFKQNESAVLWSTQKIEQVNWNAEWEKSFEPINVNNQCYIRASFHEVPPGFNYVITIDPKMSFGTGHHETTFSVIQLLLEMDFKHQDVLDMGSGTGVLGILTALKGAHLVDAIDIDEWAYTNAIENCNINQANAVFNILGTANDIPAYRYHTVIANINKNILLNDMHLYVKHLLSGGYLLLSGFYDFDLADIQQKASELGLVYENHVVRNNWVAAKFTKPA